MPINGPKYKKGDKVTYTSFGKSSDALILGAHLDDALEPYYTIEVNGREKQTDDAHLSPLNSPPPPPQASPPPQPPQVSPPPPPQVSPPQPYQPTAPMPKDPPPPPPSELPEPQDEPWDMTGRVHSQQKKSPPKPESVRDVKSKPTRGPKEHPRDEKPQKKVSRPNSSQSMEAKKLQRRRQQQRRQQHHTPQFDPYSRYYQDHRDPWLKHRDPFGSVFGGGMPIRSRL